MTARTEIKWLQETMTITYLFLLDTVNILRVRLLTFEMNECDRSAPNCDGYWLVSARASGLEIVPEAPVKIADRFKPPQFTRA